MKFLRDVLNLVVVNLMVLSSLRLFLGSYEDPYALIGGVCLSACRVSRGLLGRFFSRLT